MSSPQEGANRTQGTIMDSLSSPHQPPDAQNFAIDISDESFNFQRFKFDDAKVVAAQIAAALGKHNLEKVVVLQHLKSGELETLRPTEAADLTTSGIERFFVVEGANLYRFFVEGLSMEWPLPSLNARHIKFLARADEDDILILEREDGHVELNDDDVVRLSEHGVERLKLRKRRRTITVYYKEQSFELERHAYSTEQLMVTFSVPAGYKLDIIEGDSDFRELKPGETIHPHEGMEFSSHPPAGQSS